MKTKCATLAKSGMSPLSIPTFYKQNKNKNNSRGPKIKPLNQVKVLFRAPLTRARSGISALSIPNLYAAKKD